MSTPGIKPPSSGSSSGVKSEPATTETPKSSSTSSATASSTPTAQETKSSQQLATAKKEEFGLTLITKKLNSAVDSAKEAIVKEVEIKKVVDSAESSGLELDQRNMLSDHLRKMDYKKFEGEAKFLNETVLNTPNADRALRT